MEFLESLRPMECEAPCTERAITLGWIIALLVALI